MKGPGFRRGEFGAARVRKGDVRAAILDLLAERVTPGGRVTGLDADPGHVAAARKFTA